MMDDDTPDERLASAPPPASPEPSPADAPASDGVALDGSDEAQELARRIEQLPNDVGWLLIYVGLLGFILPGVIGTPFVVAGAAVVVPGGRKALARWATRKPRRLVRIGINQITRLVDDLERRYPTLPKTEH